MLSIRFNRWTIAAVTVAALAAPGAVLAQTPEHPATMRAQFPSKTDLKALTTSGSYLAARHASVERDAGFRCGVLSLGAAHRSEEQRTARPRLHLLAGRRRHRRGRQARRPHPDAWTSPTASRGWWSACAISSRRNMPPRSSTSTSRSADRSPIWWRRCCRAGRATAPATPRRRSPISTS